MIGKKEFLSLALGIMVEREEFNPNDGIAYWRMTDTLNMIYDAVVERQRQMIEAVSKTPVLFPKVIAEQLKQTNDEPMFFRESVWDLEEKNRKEMKKRGEERMY